MRVLAEVSQEQLRALQGNDIPPGEYHGLDKFLKRDPPTFQGEYDPEGAYLWIMKIEKILNSITCTENQKVMYASYLLTEEAENWWTHAKERLLQTNQAIHWAVFKGALMEKYFPEDVKGRKEVEFLELKQGTMSVGQYATKFEELVQFHASYRDAANENSKCIKFENGLRPDIKAAIGYQQIRNFYALVDKCRIYESDDKAKKEYLRSLGTQKNFKGGIDKKNHLRRDCPSSQVVCFKCNQPGHISIECSGRRGDHSNGRGGTGNRGNNNNNNNNNGRDRAGTQPTRGRVFTLNGIDVEEAEDLIQGTCFMNGIPLIVLYDSGATHSFIAIDLVRRLRLSTQSLSREFTVVTPTGITVNTSVVCVDCPLLIQDKTFVVNLVCLPLSHIDIILGMDWLFANHVLLDCHHKFVVFGSDQVQNDTRLFPANQVKASMKRGEQVYMLLCSLEGEGGNKLQSIPVVEDFPEVFPEDIPGLPPEREVEFTIDLVPGT
ncbi:uncharacterized protein LOC130735996 [Lotus japonicus]|uniref:uncharacterized protein LOC130735996 n=1 Tax=Lotus japonicus TaxID=34305 RepID=UPI0025909633|nr:uncharacterized protein LOC130735996 [Lotus japonicus]